VLLSHMRKDASEASARLGLRGGEWVSDRDSSGDGHEPRRLTPAHHLRGAVQNREL